MVVMGMVWLGGIAFLWLALIIGIALSLAGIIAEAGERLGVVKGRTSNG